MKITKAAEKLLVSSFTYNGRPMCSAIDTDQGSMPLWGQLALAGLVEQAHLRSDMGHQFSYEITLAGREYLERLYDLGLPYNHPFWCRTCGNSFETRQMLIDHRARKHQHILPVFPLWFDDRKHPWREGCTLANPTPKDKGL